MPSFKSSLHKFSMNMLSKLFQPQLKWRSFLLKIALKNGRKCNFIEGYCYENIYTPLI